MRKFRNVAEMLMTSAAIIALTACGGSSDNALPTSQSAVPSPGSNGAISTGTNATDKTATATDVVFVIDGSGSIDNNDFAIQLDGIQSALSNPLTIPRDGSIAVAVVQYSGSSRIEVPYTVIETQSDVDTFIAAVAGISQIQGSTGPGLGVQTADDLLTAAAVTSSFQSFCLSTDGRPNTGPSIDATVAAAQASSYGLDRFSVIAINDPGSFGPTQAQAAYGSSVFGGGTVFFVSNSVEFANTVGGLCLGDPVKLVGLEVTQAVQNLENSVKLVANKRTLVRAYVEPETGTGPITAQGRLRGRRNGAELPGSPLSSITPGGQTQAQPDALDRRAILNNSLNFDLPSSWLTGDVELEFESVSGVVCDDDALPTADDCKTTVTFNPGSELEVKFYPVRWTDTGANVQEPSNTDLNNLEARLLAMAPTASIDRTTGPTLDFGNGRPSFTTVNSRLQTRRYLDLCFSAIGCNRRYYGALVDPSTLGGRANGIPGTASSSIIKDGDVVGRNVHIHEIYHTLDRYHTVSGTPDAEGLKYGPCTSEADASAPNFPFIRSIGGAVRAILGLYSETDATLKTNVFGWDSLQNVTRDPANNFEVQSYCGNFNNKSMWTSTYTWEGVRNTINSEFSAAPPAINGNLSRFQLFRGIVDFDTGDVEILDTVSFATEAPLAPLNTGDFSLQLVDGNGGTSTTNFTPVEQSLFDDGSIQEGNKGVFFIPLPEDNTITTVRVLDDNDAQVANLSSGAAAPIVDVVFPNGGENLSPPTATLQWTGSDADGDTLSYSVLFSDDAGATYTTIATDLTTTSLEVDLTQLSETTQGLIKIQASDGIRTSEDVSDAVFTTPNSPATCTIKRPVDGELFGSVQPIVFEAEFFDVEDDQPASVQWTSDLTPNNLGASVLFSRTADELEVGKHNITLTCTDSGGYVATDTTSIEVKRILDFDSVALKGDIDGDGDVDQPDINVIIADRNTATDQSQCGATCDLNDDSVIDVIDARLGVLLCTRENCAEN